MATIEVDFDVYKALTMLRPAESTTYNDVLRGLLNLDKPGKGPISSQILPGGNLKGCIFRGVSFPHGTEFRATYKGRLYRAKISDGVWIDESGIHRNSPSEAAHAITNTNVNGWRFWECRRPDDQKWQLMDKVREEK